MLQEQDGKASIPIIAMDAIEVIQNRRVHPAEAPPKDPKHGKKNKEALAARAHGRGIVMR